MSSPIHHADDVDSALVYAPPRVRDQARAAAKGSRAAPPVEAPPPRQRSTIPRRASSGDLAMARLQQQLALDPDRVPEPPFDNSGKAWPLAGRLCAVSAIAALIAWGVVWLPTARKPAKEAPSVVAETPHVDVPAVPIVNRVKIVRVTTGSDMHPVVAEALTPQREGQATTETPPEPSPQVASSEQQAAPHEQTVSTVSSDDLAALIKRGENYLKDGDFASARLLLRRAAEAGSADAALALGATFDPLVIKQLGAIGAEADVGQARQWYQTASKLGSEAAAQELAKLAQAQR